MTFWIVIEEEHGELFVYPFNCLERARSHVHKHCTGNVTIERHVMNLGWQATEQENDKLIGGE